MKPITRLAIALVLLANPAFADPTLGQYIEGPTGNTKASIGVGIVTATAVPLGYQPISSLSVAVGLTVPAGAKTAVIIAETQAVRWRDDGTNPTATEGFPLAVGVPFVYQGSLTAIKFIEQTASAKIKIVYY